jgi:hypothetical protein
MCACVCVCICVCTYLSTRAGQLVSLSFPLAVLLLLKHSNPPPSRPPQPQRPPPLRACRVSGTFWESHGPDYSLLPAKQLEELFAARQPRPAAPAGLAPGSARPTPRGGVLDLKRATAIGIRLSRLGLPWDMVPPAAAAADAELLGGAEGVHAVLQCLPSEEEMRVLRSYVEGGGEESLGVAGLSAAERLVWELGQVGWAGWGWALG